MCDAVEMDGYLCRNRSFWHEHCPVFKKAELGWVAGVADMCVLCWTARAACATRSKWQMAKKLSNAIEDLDDMEFGVDAGGLVGSGAE